MDLFRLQSRSPGWGRSWRCCSCCSLCLLLRLRYVLYLYAKRGRSAVVLSQTRGSPSRWPASRQHAAVAEEGRGDSAPGWWMGAERRGEEERGCKRSDGHTDKPTAKHDLTHMHTHTHTDVPLPLPSQQWSTLQSLHQSSCQPGSYGR